MVAAGEATTGVAAQFAAIPTPGATTTTSGDAFYNGSKLVYDDPFLPLCFQNSLHLWFDLPILI
jgi:hypothetical protein